MWLHGETSDDGRWDAVEAIQGSPFTELSRQPSSLAWGRARVVLSELAGELIASLQDGTLPAKLSLAQVWVDRYGSLKLLDVPLEPRAGAESVVLLTGTNEQRAGRLLQSAAAACHDTEQLPGHAHDFLDELGNLPANLETIHWASERLRETADRLYRLGWDDRLGLIAVSTGTEFILYYALVFVGSMSLALVSSFTTGVRLSLVAFLAFSLVAAIGFWRHGGPVFQLGGVQVRRKDGMLASRLRCGWRNLCAWGPAVVAWSILGILFSNMMIVGDQGELDAHVYVLMVAWIVPFSGFVLRVVYAVIRPRRSLQDLLAGTHLVPV